MKNQTIQTAINFIKSKSQKLSIPESEVLIKELKNHHGTGAQIEEELRNCKELKTYSVRVISND